MEERITCIKCDASILPQTGERTGGICKPCYKKEAYSRIGQSPYGIIFDSAFKQPHLNSDTYFDLWKNLELALAGPLYNIRVEGHCDYVFKHKTGIWTGVKDTSGLVRWCMKFVDEFRERIHKVIPQSVEEKQDQVILLRKADEMGEAVRLAYDLLNKREAEINSAKNRA